MWKPGPGDLDKSGEGSGFISENGVFIRFESEHRDEVLESLKKGLFVAECSILQDDQPSAAEESAQQEKQKPEDKGNSGENREAEFFNVRSDRLDRLQNLSGELMLHMLTLDTELEKHGLEDTKRGPHIRSTG